MKKETKVRVINVDSSNVDREMIGAIGKFTGNIEEEYESSYRQTDESRCGKVYLIRFDDLGDSYYLYEDQFEIIEKKKKVINTEVDWLNAIKENFQE